jgi:cephalosporin hydroxylase
MNNFSDEVAARVDGNGRDSALQAGARSFLLESLRTQYSYNFSWLGRPVIQYPQDIVAMQELIWLVQPDLIIETGIAHGGSLILSASMLELNAACGGNPDARVLGIDIDIRPHNREAIIAHPMSRRIDMIQGSSIAPEVIDKVKAHAGGRQRVLVCLDSNHTHDHVLAELEAYAPLATADSYCIVFDTVVEDIPKALSGDRPWGPGDNPKTAVHEYLRRVATEGRTAADGRPLRFEIDKSVENKLLVTVAPDGYLRRVA